MAEIRIVNTDSLNVRATPTSRSSINIISRFYAGDEVEMFPDPNNTSSFWVRIKKIINNKELVGYVGGKYLDKKSDTTPVTQMEFNSLEAVHLLENKRNVTRSNPHGRVYPLGESSRPTRDLNSRQKRIDSLHKIVDWLDVEKSERYQPTSKYTYCNIYTYDYCYLGGAYLPRVWWNPDSQCALLRNKKVNVVLDYLNNSFTVREMNANNLHLWLEEFGAKFGWERKFDVTEVQKDANEGKICIITAQQLDANRSGHICPIVPETDSLKADYNDDGTVKFPLQSQAGGRNRKYFTHFGDHAKWWVRINYRDFGFWVHD